MHVSQCGFQSDADTGGPCKRYKMRLQAPGHSNEGGKVHLACVCVDKHEKRRNSRVYNGTLHRLTRVLPSNSHPVARESTPKHPARAVTSILSERRLDLKFLRARKNWALPTPAPVDLDGRERDGKEEQARYEDISAPLDGAQPNGIQAEYSFR